MLQNRRGPFVHRRDYRDGRIQQEIRFDGPGAAAPLVIGSSSRIRYQRARRIEKSARRRQVRSDLIVARNAGTIITGWERDFLVGVLDRGRWPLSPKQRDVLNKIAIDTRALTPKNAAAFVQKYHLAEGHIR